MDRYEDNVVVPVHQFYDLMDTAFIIRHLDQTAEYTYPVVDMDDVITQVEGT